MTKQTKRDNVFPNLLQVYQKRLFATLCITVGVTVIFFFLLA